MLHNFIRSNCPRWLLALGVSLIPVVGSAADDDLWTKRDAAVTRAIEYLASKQSPEGAFTPQAGPAITALVTIGLLQNGRTVDDPLVAKALAYLEKYVRADGGIYSEGSNYLSYETCISLQAFALANKDGRYDKHLKAGDQFAKGLQWGEGDGKGKTDPSFGGMGYAKGKRADLSNTVMFLDALKACGNDGNDEAVQQALVFVSRCQNLESEFNTTEFSVKNPDGGFFYSPAAGGSSPAGKTDEGGLRSYGAMTYAGLKSLIYAGVGPDDPRVKAALAWLKKNYAVDTNPGMGDAGLYYYYHTFAKCLDAMGNETFTDEKGTVHSWREELAAELIKRQQPSGAWTNTNSRWMEGDPNLVTGYALMTLSYLRPRK